MGWLVLLFALISFGYLIYAIWSIKAEQMGWRKHNWKEK